MSLFGKLFGKKTLQPSTPAVNAGSTKEQDLITVYDTYGREFKITKQEWRDKVLLGNLDTSRDDPDQLYSVISSALHDGFVQDVLPYAKHLQKIDPMPSRAATLLGVVYLELNQLDAAECTLRDYIQRYGEEAYVLANLAKVIAKRGNTTQADTTLWRALELDPNQDNGLVWYWSLARERGGDKAGLGALRKVSGIAGSWRARLWIARSFLERKELDAALSLYDEALAVASRPVPADLLMQMSGDLGTHGHLIELLKRTTPLFDVAVHGLPVGNNLIKANIDVGRIDHARAIVDQLYAVNRPDYLQTLSFWETEIAKARIEQENSDIQAPLSVTMLVFRGPIWLTASSPAASLFPVKDAAAVVVCFLGASVEHGTTGEPRMQIADTNGRITRAVTTFLCEQLHLRTSAVGQVMQPWIAPGGLMISGQPWDAETAIDQAKACTPQGDYVVLTHLVATSQPYTLSYRLLRCIDGSLLDNASFHFDLANAEPTFGQAVGIDLSSCASCMDCSAGCVPYSARYGFQRLSITARTSSGGSRGHRRWHTW
jgi:tetratricopeptide (TPR) repeat protein